MIKYFLKILNIYTQYKEAALQIKLNIILLITQKNAKKRINIKFNFKKCLKNS